MAKPESQKHSQKEPQQVQAHPASFQPKGELTGEQLKELDEKTKSPQQAEEERKEKDKSLSKAKKN